MTEDLKHIYNHTFFEQFTGAVSKELPQFDKQKFLHKIHDEGWNQRELKQRMKHIAAVLKLFLLQDFKRDIEVLVKVIHHLEASGVSKQNLEYMFMAQYIELNGLDKLNLLQTSFKAFEFITSFTSCEFAIRPFIIKYPQQSMKQMLEWSKHSNPNVRRLSSEGCRPRLPWAMSLSEFKKDPLPIVPILEILKEDRSEYVRRSVANNLNDIAKDHPTLVLDIAKKWKGKSKETDWIIKHGCRSLLKQGHPDVLKLFDFQMLESCEILELNLVESTIKIGDTLQFSFQLQHHEATNKTLRMEYAIYYMKSNGMQNKKMFKITENTYAPQTVYSFSRKQSFRNMTTRNHYIGQHKLEIVVNGKGVAQCDFEVIGS